MKKQLTETRSVLMPVCSEAEITENVVEGWYQEVFQYLPEGSEPVFDGGDSRDGTLEILERSRAKYPYIHIFYSKKDSFGASARRLYTQARCPLIVFTDSDGQYVASGTEIEE